MFTLILSFLAGLGLTIALLFVIFGTVISCAGVIAIIRAAINPALGNLAKVIWIICCFIPGVGLLYFAFVDKNGFLKFTGWACIIFFALVGLTGGTAMQGIVHSFENEVQPETYQEWKFQKSYPRDPAFQRPHKTPDKTRAEDDSGLSL